MERAIRVWEREERNDTVRFSGTTSKESRKTRSVLKIFLENVIRNAVIYTEHAHRKTVTAMDIVTSCMLSSDRAGLFTDSEVQGFNQETIFALLSEPSICSMVAQQDAANSKVTGMLSIFDELGYVLRGLALTGKALAERTNGYYLIIVHNMMKTQMKFMKYVGYCFPMN
nr:Histone H4 [Ipomoea batatas]GMC55734.1 Histone H4 [Ipomoea batatas]